MKLFLYILTISLLLWVVFNPNGIVEYQKQLTIVKQLEKEIEKEDNEIDLRNRNLTDLENYILSILDDSNLSNKAVPYLDIIEKELIFRGNFPINKNILRFDKKKASLK